MAYVVGMALEGIGGGREALVEAVGNDSPSDFTIYRSTVRYLSRKGRARKAAAGCGKMK